MKSKVRSILFAIILLGLSLFNILTPSKSFSNKENRYLAQFPELKFENILSGKFSTDFEKYASDQFVSRDNWIGLKTISQLAILKKDNGRVYFGKEDYLFDVESELTDEQFALNIKNLNKFAASIKEEIKITALLIPTKTEVLKDKGAFYAYEKYMKLVGGSPLSEDDFLKEIVSDDFFGTIYRKANFYLGEPDRITKYTPKDNIDLEIFFNNDTKEEQLYDSTFLDKTDKYSFFLGGDKAIVEINTSVENGKTIVVMKDSYANSMIPFLVNNYEHIIMVDTRYYNSGISQFVNERDVDEVLLLYNIQTFVNEKSFLKFGI